jgi:phage replication-related protein YjqB (UPF0714/DUF867 family)
MTYTNYNELRNNEKEGEDYQIRFHEGNSGILIIASHGGCIEPGTTEMAHAAAGKEHSLYSFEGLKIEGNNVLHITSTRFDEPIGLKLAKKARSILAIHGCRDVEPIIYLGGKDGVLREEIRNSLEENGIQVGENPRFPGLHADNLCNRSFRGMGVQMEISLALRKQIFDDLRRDHRTPRGEAFDNIIQSLRRALANYLRAL